MRSLPFAATLTGGVRPNGMDEAGGSFDLPPAACSLKEQGTLVMRKHWPGFAARFTLTIAIAGLGTIFGLGQVDPVQLVDAVHRAHGGLWDSQRTGDWKAEGTITLFNNDRAHRSFPLLLLRKGDERIQRCIYQEGGEIRQGSDGIKEWDSLNGQFFNRPAGKVKALIASRTRRSLQALFKHRKRGLRLQYRGSRDGDYLIEAVKKGAATTYLIDISSLLVTAIEFEYGKGRDPFQGKAAPNTYRVEFADYQLVQGVLTPFRIARFINGIRFEEIRFDAVSYDLGLADASFTP